MDLCAYWNALCWRIDEMSDHATLIARCRRLEQRFIALHLRGQNSEIAIQWARDWANDLLDRRGMASLYAHWIDQQERRADRLEALAQGVAA
jgi:hypothetical protein